jgi:hypothetical protein
MALSRCSLDCREAPTSSSKLDRSSEFWPDLSSRRSGGPISKYASGLEINKNMVMGPDGARKHNNSVVR